ncbi:hypothetical protein [Parendozoicomonas haliclonae]|uniref:Lipoprotein n=1 Tax=Parendozoicomonas haliclonae TaxID=1960125 RepID=A0A1X7AIS0_9GAMM|nr:hypothetical protein [Parendozoicomonas haliclonae]SMA45442.1 hypothetical protein EHSB41UT_01920 [Parendozoicomonas haliclonae]
MKKLLACAGVFLVSLLTSCDTTISTTSAPETSGQVRIHPLCIDELVPLSGSVDQSITVDLQQCASKYKAFSFTHPKPWQASWEKQQSDDSSPLYEELPAFAEYQVIGGLASGLTLLSYKVNYGGSGTFSYALVVEGFDGHSGKLTAYKTVIGGDRCDGGIKDAMITSPESFMLVKHATLAELVRRGEAKADEGTENNLPDCSTCCAGTILESYQVDGAKQLKQALFYPPADTLQAASQNTNERCLYLRLGKGQYSQRLNPEQLHELQTLFHNLCEGKGSD